MAEGTSCNKLFILFHLPLVEKNNGFFSFEGLVVSTCLGGAFVGSIFSGWIADGVGRRRAFQLCALPMIIGASMRYA
jgi:MFS family permease